MSEFTCGSVQGIGVTPYEHLPVNPTIFTEISVPELVTIPVMKPDIEQVVSITVDSEIISSKLVKTAVGTSNEGQILTGYKLILELKLRQKVKYIADEPTQTVHAAHFEKLVNSIFVVVPTTIEVGDPPVAIPIETLFKQGRLVIKPYIEDIYGELRSKRTIFKNITLLINVSVI